MDSPAPLYIDTNVAADRVFAPEPKRSELRRRCEGAITSDYVESEYRCTFLRDAVLLYNLLLDAPGIEEALERLGRFYGGLVENRGQQVLRVLMQPQADGGEGLSALPKDELQAELEYLIEDLIMERFWWGLDGAASVTETTCRRASLEPARVGRHYEFRLVCDESNSQRCGIKAFWDQRAQELAILATHQALTASQQLRQLQKAAQGLRDDGAPHGDRCWRKLADAIVVLSAPAGAVVCSQDADVPPICQALGQPSTTP